VNRKRRNASGQRQMIVTGVALTIVFVLAFALISFLT